MTSGVQYLGDGLYAADVNGHIELRANDAHHPTDIVYLEPSVVDAFIWFIKQQRGVTTL